METIECDTLIIGAGSAGCVLAARLSADPKRQVVLLEAGPAGGNKLKRVISGQFQMTGDARFDWRYSTEPEANMANRRLLWPRGKVLGGSSTVNGMIAIRGHPDDYDAWSQLGCDGWSWREVLPYFRRLESSYPANSGTDPALHHVGGPLPVTSPRARHFLCDQLAAAARETLGVGENRDFNGATQEGAGYYAMNITRGLIPARASAASAYLKAAAKRANLRVITEAHVHRISFQGTRATGAIFQRRDTRCIATARREVILSAGSIGSPQLLQLSGIGDGELLRSLSIDVVAPLPAVGENLQDHLQIASLFRFHAHTPGQKVQNVGRRFLTAMQGAILQTGLFYGANHFGLFLRSDPALNRPDVQFYVSPAAGSIRSADRCSILSISGWQLRPESRGRICIRNADPFAAPAIFANYLSSEVDQRAAVGVLRIAQRLAASQSMHRYGVERFVPIASDESDEALLDFARATAQTTYHPVGTCRMGSDPGSVVDSRLRVRGVQGLYVADASIMPTLISGNTHLPAVMIGEKASDLVVEDELNAATPDLIRTMEVVSAD